MEKLTFKEAWAIKDLIDICEQIGLFVENDYDETSLVTTGEYLDVNFIDKEDWELCLSVREKLLDL